MAEDLHPDAIRAQTFATSRRGFDRAEVEAFQEQAAARVAQLEESLQSLETRLGQLGITDLADLKKEFDIVGEDVREILQAARDAAEDMRQRASADAANWRSEAEAAAAEMKDEAQRQAEAVRGEGWETASSLLEDAKAAAAELAAKASEEALFVRAEAEREALRLTGDAKRDAEEALHSAQIEAEKLVANASQESESALAAAQQSADLAQERVRALEQRREELLAELEQLRVTLTDLEDHIEGRRGELTHATTDPTESAVRIITEEDDPTKPDIGDWLDEDATVRLVPPDEQMPPPIPIGLVDADDLVAEVESLRSSSPPAGELVTGGSGSSAESASLDFEITSGEIAAVADAAATAELVAAPAEPAVEPETEPETEPEVAPQPEPAVAPEPEPEPKPDIAPEPAPEAAAQPEPAAEGQLEPDADVSTDDSTDSAVVAAAPAATEGGGIDDLFASLRTPAADGPPAVAPETAEVPESSPEEPAPAEATEPVEEAATDATAAARPLSVEPWDLRDRSLMPVTNEVLRSIKRQIVDVQNAVLEELRTEAEDWRPKRAMFDQVLDDAAAALASKCYLAGIDAAGELTEQPPPDIADASTHDLVALVTDLWEAVVDAIEATAGGTSRERGASVGRIFRAWRTDEAERRVRQVAHAEYNLGVAAGLAALGFEHAIEPAGRDIADPDAIVIPAA